MTPHAWLAIVVVMAWHGWHCWLDDGDEESWGKWEDSFTVASLLHVSPKRNFAHLYLHSAGRCTGTCAAAAEGTAVPTGTSAAAAAAGGHVHGAEDATTLWVLARVLSSNHRNVHECVRLSSRQGGSLYKDPSEADVVVVKEDIKPADAAWRQRLSIVFNTPSLL